MANPVDDGGNVRVDHVWGNMPIQPDDARGANTLDPALDNHVIVTTGRYGYPSYTPDYIGDGDATPNAVVPNVVGLSAAAAQTAIEDAGLVYAAGATTDNAGGATAENDGLVASSSPVAGSNVNSGDTVTVSLYEYTA